MIRILTIILFALIVNNNLAQDFTKSTSIVLSQDQTTTFTPVITDQYIAASENSYVAVFNRTDGKKIWVHNYSKQTFDWYYCHLFLRKDNLYIIGLGNYEIRNLATGELKGKGTLDKNIGEIKYHEATDQVICLRSRFDIKTNKATNDIVSLSIEDLAIKDVLYQSKDQEILQLIRLHDSTFIVNEGKAGVLLFKIKNEIKLINSFDLTKHIEFVSDLKFSADGQSIYLTDLKSGKFIILKNLNKDNIKSYPTPIVKKTYSTITVNPINNAIYIMSKNKVYTFINEAMEYKQIPANICYAKLPAYESVISKDGKTMLINTICNGSYNLTKISSLEMVNLEE